MIIELTIDWPAAATGIFAGLFLIIVIKELYKTIIP